MKMSCLGSSFQVSESRGPTSSHLGSAFHSFPFPFQKSMEGSQKTTYGAMAAGKKDFASVLKSTSSGRFSVSCTPSLPTSNTGMEMQLFWTEAGKGSWRFSLPPNAVVPGPLTSHHCLCGFPVLRMEGGGKGAASKGRGCGTEF